MSTLTTKDAAQWSWRDGSGILYQNIIDNYTL